VRKLAYVPFQIATLVLSLVITKRVSKAVLAATTEEGRKPKPRTGESTLPRIAAVAAVQGATVGVTKVTLDRSVAATFRHLFGAWPEKPKAPQA